MNNLISEKPIEVRKLTDVAYLVLILGAFAWAKEFLLPLILAILISFLLAPIISRLERWHFPRAVAVLSVVAIAFALIGGLCSTLFPSGPGFSKLFTKVPRQHSCQVGGHSKRAARPTEFSVYQCWLDDCRSRQSLDICWRRSKAGANQG
jgi:predicted PurR-regulated permease PerM